MISNLTCNSNDGKNSSCLFVTGNSDIQINNFKLFNNSNNLVILNSDQNASVNINNLTLDQNFVNSTSLSK